MPFADKLIENLTHYALLCTPVQTAIFIECACGFVPVAFDTPERCQTLLSDGDSLVRSPINQLGLADIHVCGYTYKLFLKTYIFRRCIYRDPL